MSYRNLKAEMRREGITQSDIAGFLEMSTNNFGMKVNGRVPFTVNEAWMIRDRFFPMATLDYLFAMSDERTKTASRIKN